MLQRSPSQPCGLSFLREVGLLRLGVPEAGQPWEACFSHLEIRSHREGQGWRLMHRGGEACSRGVKPSTGGLLGDSREYGTDVDRLRCLA